jgi:hypothetical protein
MRRAGDAVRKPKKPEAPELPDTALAMLPDDASPMERLRHSYLVEMLELARANRASLTKILRSKDPKIALEGWRIVAETLKALVDPRGPGRGGTGDEGAGNAPVHIHLGVPRPPAIDVSPSP